jgi:hypothetical protein
MAGTGEATDPQGGGAALRARAILDLGDGARTLDFDAVTVNTDDPQTLVVALADAAGRSVTLLLPRAELKRLVSWRTLLSL